MPTHIAYANHYTNGTLTYFYVLSNAWCFINFKIYKIHVVFCSRIMQYKRATFKQLYYCTYSIAHTYICISTTA